MSFNDDLRSKGFRKFSTLEFRGRLTLLYISSISPLDHLDLTRIAQKSKTANCHRVQYRPMMRKMFRQGCWVRHDVVSRSIMSPHPDQRVSHFRMSPCIPLLTQTADSTDKKPRLPQNV
jgi:hypothetical protein